MFSGETNLINLFEMSKISTFVLLVLCVSLAVAQNSNNQQLYFSVPVSPAAGHTAVTLFDVFPAVDTLLKNEYWYYLRNANTLYQAGVDSPSEYLIFTIYRNIVGTFLVITTWNKTTQTLQINTFVRLGDGFDSSSGANYAPVKIDPFVVSVALKPDEYMIAVAANGSITVTGNQTLYNQVNTNANGGSGGSGSGSGSGSGDSFNITEDMAVKCKLADDVNREQFWYYLTNATLISESDIPTNQQYYCVFVYLNVVGTFLSISSYNLATKAAGVNTFVRLGNGLADGANYGPVQLNPSLLHLSSFNSSAAAA